MVSRKPLRDLIRELKRSKLPMVKSKSTAFPSEDPDRRGQVMVINNPSRKSVAYTRTPRRMRKIPIRSRRSIFNTSPD